MKMGYTHIWVFPKIGVGPQNGWFIKQKPIKMDDLGVYHYFRKHPYTISPSSSTNLRSSEYPALLGIKPGQDLENFANWNAWELGFSQLKYSLDLMEKNCPPVEQKLSGDENGSAGKCRWLLKKMLFPRSWTRSICPVDGSFGSTKLAAFFLVVDKHPRNPKTPISYQLFPDFQTENMVQPPNVMMISKSNAAWPKGRKGRIQVGWGRSSLRCPGRMM